MVVGIDPGPVQSAYAVVNSDYSIQEAGKVENYLLEKYLKNWDAENVAIESIQSYGAPVGKETFETCYAIGAFRYVVECCNYGCAHLIPRQEYANAICGAKANDSMLRQALGLRFGGYKKGDALSSLNGTDLRSAYAVAVYWMDAQAWKGKK